MWLGISTNWDWGLLFSFNYNATHHVITFSKQSIMAPRFCFVNYNRWPETTIPNSVYLEFIELQSVAGRLVFTKYSLCYPTFHRLPFNRTIWLVSANGQWAEVIYITSGSKKLRARVVIFHSSFRSEASQKPCVPDEELQVGRAAVRLDPWVTEWSKHLPLATSFAM